LVIGCGADFVKTGTGWIPGGSNLERIRKIKEHCGDRVKVKAAGGIRTREDMEEFLALGCERIGTSSAISVLENA
ncbi:MAG: 2-deoxyribose-5-phosphate aldolase, partial [Lachnospiraceae bacterium]|nr:2-deoxyribose-5-phosphate aldolase [Lachnospiraceae bacterium]